MPRYTTKGRAKRIKLDYLQRSHPFRRWKIILTIAVPAVAVAWIVAATVRGDPRLYTSGPVSQGHAMFGLECRLCHRPEGAQGRLAPVVNEPPTQRGPTFRLRVSDEACLTCHDAPAHNASQTFTPACATCHVEHKGRIQLASMSDRKCTQCHDGLKTKPGASATFAPTIRSFHSDHPEFAVSVKDGARTRRVPLDRASELKDAAQISFNHEFHLEPGVRGVDELSAGPEARGVTKTPAGDRLNCGYCHQPDDSQAYMAPVRFAKHCVACHALDFDPRLPSAVVPHDTPRMVRAFLRDFFATAAEECRKPGALQDGAATELRRRCQTIGPVKGDDRPDDGAAAEPWIATQLTTVFKQNCSFCHRVSVAPGRLPEVAATAIPTRWFPHSRFDHRPHRVLGCIECHQTARSRETTDVLLPSIKTCRDCHRQGADAARSSCVECHYYHEKALERNQDGPFAIRDLRQRRLDPGRREP